MEYEWDEKKNEANLTKHGVDFSLIEVFDWATALDMSDDRHSKAELRYIALGFIGDRLYMCIYTWRHSRCRIISLRKANERERRFYHEKT